jgi:DNA replication protein DnaC
VYNATVGQDHGNGLAGCPECNGSGWIHLVKDGVAGVQRCDCFRQARVQRLIASARIPARYAHCELSNFDLSEKLTTKSIEFAKLAAETFVEEFPSTSPIGLLFMGPQGVGKTHLAIGIIKALMRRKGVPCMFRAFPELLKEIQMSYSPVSESSELSLLAPVLETEVLVLDELGSQTPSTWVKDTVSYVLNYRYSENKVTIFTTNYLDHEDPLSSGKGVFYSLRDRIGDQMRSRLYEMCKTIVMAGNDFRQYIKDAEYRQFKKRR